MGETRPVVGVDLGGTHMQFGVVSGDGRLIARAGEYTHAEQGDQAVLDRLAQGVRGVIAQAGLHPSDVAGVGVGVPSPCDVERGIALDTVNLGWRNIPVVDELQRRLGLRVTIENDVNAAAWGEFVLGAGRGASDLFAVWVGTGIGGGFVLNGRVYHGALGTAGEFGMCHVLPGNPTGLTRLEEICARSAIAQRLTDLIRSNQPSVLRDKAWSSERLTAGDIAGACGAGDELTLRVVGESARLLGIAIANTVTVLSVARIIVGGGLVEAMGEAFVAPVRASAREHVFPVNLADRLEIVPTALGADAGLLGAAMLARARLEQIET